VASHSRRQGVVPASNRSTSEATNLSSGETLAAAASSSEREEREERVMLFVREQREQGGVTEPFVCLGFARYERHEGDRIWFVTEWRSAGGWGGRSRRRGCR